MAGTPLELMALPRVAIEKSLCSMTPIDLLKFSRTSKRGKDIIKTINFNVHLGTDGSDVDVSSSKFSGTFKIEAKKEEAEWRDAVTEITSLFRTSLAYIRVKTKEFHKTWKWLREEQNGLKHIDLTVTNTEEDPQRIIRALVDNSEFTELKDLTFQMNTSPSFKYVDSFVFKNPPKRLWIKNASWFTVQNLMDSKVETCDLYNPELTNEDINVMLKQWIDNDGPLSNLKSIEMWRPRNSMLINNNVAFSGFENERGIVCMNSADLKLTCGKEFYFDVGDSMGRFSIHKKLFANERAVVYFYDESSESEVSSEAEDSDVSDEEEDSDGEIDSDHSDHS